MDPHPLAAVARRAGVASDLPALGTYGRGVAFVIGAALAFGTLGTLSNVAYRAGMSPPAWTALRAAIGAAVLAVLVTRHGSPFRLRRIPLRQRVALSVAIVANATLNLVLFAAYGTMSVVLVLAVYFAYPILVAAASVALGRERFTRARVVGLGLAVAGLVLVLAPQLAPGAGITVTGLICAAVAAACQAIYLVVSRAGYPEIPSDRATALILTGGALLAAPIAVLASGPAGPLAWVGSPGAWLAVVVGGTLGAAAAKVWLLRGVRRIGGTRTAVLMLGEPLFGVALAALFLGQAVTTPEVGGGLLILVAALLVQRPAPARPGDAVPAVAAPAAPA